MEALGGALIAILVMLLLLALAAFLLYKFREKIITAIIKKQMSEMSPEDMNKLAAAQLQQVQIQMAGSVSGEGGNSNKIVGSNSGEKNNVAPGNKAVPASANSGKTNSARQTNFSLTTGQTQEVSAIQKEATATDKTRDSTKKQLRRSPSKEKTRTNESVEHDADQEMPAADACTSRETELMAAGAPRNQLQARELVDQLNFARIQERLTDTQKKMHTQQLVSEEKFEVDGSESETLSSSEQELVDHGYWQKAYMVHARGDRSREELDKFAHDDGAPLHQLREEQTMATMTVQDSDIDAGGKTSPKVRTSAAKSLMANLASEFQQVQETSPTVGPSRTQMSSEGSQKKIGRRSPAGNDTPTSITTSNKTDLRDSRHHFPVSQSTQKSRHSSKMVPKHYDETTARSARKDFDGDQAASEHPRNWPIHDKRNHSYFIV